MSVKISFRKDRNRWEVDYFFEGKRKRPLFREEREALNFARKIELGLKPESRDSITVEQAMKKYFDSESAGKSRSSKSNDRRYLNLLGAFMHNRGVEKLVSIELSDMEAFRDWLLTLKMEPWIEPEPKAMHMSSSTVNRCIAMMKRFFIKHVQWKNIPDTPCKYLEFLDAESKPRQAMKGDQYLKALEKAADWLKPVMQFTFLTGSPGSCIERLCWEHCDFENRSYFVIRKKGKARKTRRIPMAMTDQVFALLLLVRNQCPNMEGPVFRDDRGQSLLADRISKAGNDAIRSAGLKGVTMYSMRHGLASDLTAANVATELVRQAMGHASITTTQRYANKSGLQPVRNVLESVRGGNLVANGDFERRLSSGEKGV